MFVHNIGDTREEAAQVHEGLQCVSQLVCVAGKYIYFTLQLFFTNYNMNE